MDDGRIGHPDDGDAVDHDLLTGLESSQFPPESAARSMITGPLPIPSTMAAVTSTRCRSSRDLRRGDDHVGGGHLGGQQFLLASQLLGRLLPGVAACTLTGVEPEIDELRPEALHLFLGRRSHVVGTHHGAEPARRGDGLEPSHSGPHDQHLGRRHGTGRRHEHGEELGQVLGGRQPGSVTGHRGLRGERVHGLGPADARQEVEAVDRRPLAGQGSHRVEIGQRLQERDDRDPGRVGGDLGGRRRLHPGHKSGGGDGRRGIAFDRRPRLAVTIVGETGGVPGARLQNHIGVGLDQPCGHLGDHGHPVLTRARFLDHGHLHGKRYTANPLDGLRYGAGGPAVIEVPIGAAAPTLIQSSRTP